MIGFFTDPNDSKIIDIVREAAALAAPGAEFRVYDIKPGQDFEALDYRKFGWEIGNLDACVIDGDQTNVVVMSIEFGSIARGMTYRSGPRGANEQLLNDVDRRVSVLTRKSSKHSDLFGHFGAYYTFFSLQDIPASDHVAVLAEWLHDTVSRSMPKVFVSYRSTQRQYATKVANSLRRRGAAVWFDEISIQPGDSIPDAINRGLGWCTHMVLIVDETFFDSEWTKAEYESVLYRHLSGRGQGWRRQTAERAIIPLFLVDPAAEEMPALLQRIRGIDCRQKNVRSVTNQLWNAISAVGPK